MVIHLFDSPRAVPFFISEVDERGVQDAVFTVGLSVAGVAQMLYAWHLYHTVDAQRPKLWFIATLVGLLAALNSILVSQFDTYDYVEEHVLTAMLAFGGGVFWSLLSTVALGSKATVAGHRLRNIGFAMAAIGFVVMLAAFQPAANNFDATGMSTTEFLNEAQEGVVIAAPAEYVLVAGLLLCLSSFRHELRSANGPEN
tara:strand:+ start:486 stop:1082 length:597 start_codon:yes stop_codon:yes gene_type:complete